MRIFGRLDFPQMLKNVLKSSCYEDPVQKFGQAMLNQHMIPIDHNGKINGNSVFIFKKI